MWDILYDMTAFKFTKKNIKTNFAKKRTQSLICIFKEAGKKHDILRKVENLHYF